jgi:hypothetical protein
LVEKPETKNLYKIVFSDTSLQESCMSVKDFENFSLKFPQIAKILKDPEILTKNKTLMEKAELESWQNTAILIMGNLWKFKASNVFHAPVNPVKLGMTNS